MSGRQQQASRALLEQRALLDKRAKRARSIVHEQSAILMQYNINPALFADGLYNAMIAVPELANCRPESLFKAVRKSCVDGICPDGREGALVPTKGGDVIYMPMREGLARTFCEATGAVCRVGVVYEADEFEIDLGLEPRIEHVPDFRAKERGPVLFAWWMAKMASGDVFVDTMSLDELNQAKATSRAKSGPWVNWFERMCRKSVFKRGVNANRHLIPKDQSQRFASILDEDMEHGTVEVDAGGDLPSGAEIVDVDPDTGEVIPPEGEQQEEQAAEAKPDPEFVAQMEAAEEAQEEAAEPKQEAKPKPKRQAKPKPDPDPPPAASAASSDEPNDEFKFSLPE